MKRIVILLGLLVALIAVAAFGSYGGQRVIGFSYGVAVDNRAAECPNTVVAVDGGRVTLDDGRVIAVTEQVVGPEWLAEQLERCENRVRFDPAEQKLYTLRRVAFCSFDRPQRRQWITIPVRRVELRQYTSDAFASARQVPAAGGPASHPARP